LIIDLPMTRLWMPALEIIGIATNPAPPDGLADSEADSLADSEALSLADGL